MLAEALFRLLRAREADPSPTTTGERSPVSRRLSTLRIEIYRLAMPNEPTNDDTTDKLDKDVFLHHALRMMDKLQTALTLGKMSRQAMEDAHDMANNQGKISEDQYRKDMKEMGMDPEIDEYTHSEPTKMDVQIGSAELALGMETPDDLQEWAREIQIRAMNQLIENIEKTLLNDEYFDPESDKNVDPRDNPLLKLDLEDEIDVLRKTPRGQRIAFRRWIRSLFHISFRSWGVVVSQELMNRLDMTFPEGTNMQDHRILVVNYDENDNVEYEEDEKPHLTIIKL